MGSDAVLVSYDGLCPLHGGDADGRLPETETTVWPLPPPSDLILIRSDFERRRIPGWRRNPLAFGWRTGVRRPRPPAAGPRRGSTTKGGAGGRGGEADALAARRRMLIRQTSSNLSTVMQASSRELVRGGLRVVTVSGILLSSTFHVSRVRTSPVARPRPSGAQVSSVFLLYYWPHGAVLVTARHQH